MKTIVALATILLASSAFASNVFFPPAHVTSVESTYMPNMISFKIDQGDSRCPSGMALYFNSQDLGSPNADNIKSTFALLLAAKLSQTPVTIVYDNTAVGTDPNSCVVKFVTID